MKPKVLDAFTQSDDDQAIMLNKSSTTQLDIDQKHNSSQTDLRKESQMKLKLKSSSIKRRKKAKLTRKHFNFVNADLHTNLMTTT